MGDEADYLIDRMIDGFLPSGPPLRRRGKRKLRSEVDKDGEDLIGALAAALDPTTDAEKLAEWLRVFPHADPETARGMVEAAARLGEIAKADARRQATDVLQGNSIWDCF